jgi:hypothetical protein
MFYRKVDLRKLYEAMDEPVGMENNPGVVMGDDNAPVETAPQAAESFPTPPESNPGENKEAVKVMKGMTYAFPVTQEDYNQLTQLINAGIGDWTSSTPLKTVSDPNSNAMMEIGGQSKPVYLKIVLAQTKGERLSAPLNLEDEDRVYVALMTSPNDLKSNLDAAVDITNYVKLTVKTPLMKSGTNVEHSLNMWKNFQSDEETPVETSEFDANNIEQIQSEQPGLAAQLDLPESRKRFVGGKWKPVNEAFKMVRYDDGSSSNRWLYDDVTKKAYLVSSPKRYQELVAKYGISGAATAMPKSEIDAAAAAARRPVIVDDLAKVEAGTVLKSGGSGKAVEEIQTMLGITVDGKFGPQTKEAVKKFQQENGLKVDGIVGKNTLTALRKKKSDAEAADAKAKADADAAAAAEADAKAKADAEAAAAAEAKAKADAEAAAAAQRQADDKDLEEMSADELRAELDKSKIELKAARQEARQERRSDRQDRRETRRDARQDRREDRQEERLRRRVEKIQKKIEKATNESKIYNFDEFVKIVHGFQSK